jgi:biopolymer transport protein ExbD
MRFKRHMKFEQGLKPMDMAPLINMLFLLLVFFMLTCGFMAQPGIKVDLPKAVTSEVVRQGNLDLVISSENTISANNKDITTQELQMLLKQTANAKGSVLIKADRRASLGRIVEVWDMCRVSGVAQVNIATNKE